MPDSFQTSDSEAAAKTKSGGAKEIPARIGQGRVFVRYTPAIAANLTLYNVIGQTVYNAESDKGFFVLFREKLGAEIYILHFKTTGFEIKQKLILTR